MRTIRLVWLVALICPDSRMTCSSWKTVWPTLPTISPPTVELRRTGPKPRVSMERISNPHLARASKPLMTTDLVKAIRP